MNQKTNKRKADILRKYPVLKADFERQYTTRREEIIDMLLRSDENYQELTRQRADASQALLKILNENNKSSYYEVYSDAIFIEEMYELDVVYREAFLDAVDLMERLGLLKSP